MDTILNKYGTFDVLPYYLEVSNNLKKFLANRELATKIWIPKGPRLLKRGSLLPKLYIKDLNEIDNSFLSLRKKHFKDVKEKLNDKQKLVWQYFVPRKSIELLYATNHENPNRPIERIFFDIDRSNLSADISREVASEIINLIESDKEFILKNYPTVTNIAVELENEFTFIDQNEGTVNRGHIRVNYLNNSAK